MGTGGTLEPDKHLHIKTITGACNNQVVVKNKSNLQSVCNNNITFCHQNIQCLSNKVLSLTVSLQERSCDFLLLTEHWQKAEQLNQIILKNYSLCTYLFTSHYKNGGVAIFKNNSSQVIFNVCVEGVLECACLNIYASKIKVIVLYRPPSGDFNSFLSLFDGLLSKVYDPFCSLIVGGDFNLNFLMTSPLLSIFLDLISTYNLLYTVRTPTRIARESSTCIDNFLITSEEKYKVSVVDLSLSDHFSQFLEIKAVLTKQANSPSYLIKRNFSEQNIAHFLEYLNEEQWHDVYCQVCPNKAFECFSSQMLFYYELCFPLVKININNKFKCKKVNLPPELDRLRDKVTLYNDLSKNNNKYKDISKYLNSIYKDKLKQFFVLQNDKIIQSSDNKPKAMWQIVKNLQKRD